MRRNDRDSQGGPESASGFGTALSLVPVLNLIRLKLTKLCPAFSEGSWNVPPNGGLQCKNSQGLRCNYVSSSRHRDKVMRKSQITGAMISWSFPRSKHKQGRRSAIRSRSSRYRESRETSSLDFLSTSAIIQLTFCSTPKSKVFDCSSLERYSSSVSCVA